MDRLNTQTNTIKSFILCPYSLLNITIMEQEKSTTRFSVKQMYCTQEVADAVNNHQWLANSFTGADRAQRILDALNFAEQHKTAIESGLYDQADKQIKLLTEQIDQLTQNNTQLQQKADRAEALQQTIDALQDDLQTARDAAGSTEEGNIKLTEQIHNLQQTIADRDAQIQALQDQQINWQKIATVFDPAYTAVVEQITDRLNAKFHHDAQPQDVLISFFIRYYFNQEAEFDGMPFIIRPREIMQIVRTVYPDMTADILRKALNPINNA